MPKALIQYVVSKTKDNSMWSPSIYHRDEKEAIKLADNKLKEDGIVAVKVTKIETTDIYLVEKEKE